MWRMGLYMFFPVTIFYLFHQPQWFEESTIELRRKLYPPSCEANLIELHEFAAEWEALRRKKEAAALAKSV